MQPSGKTPWPDEVTVLRAEIRDLKAIAAMAVAAWMLVLGLTAVAWTVLHNPEEPTQCMERDQ